MKTRKLLAILLSLVMVLSLLPATALAENETVSVTSDTTSWTDGNTYVVSGEVTVSERISVTGNVTLQLSEGSVLNAQKGIVIGHKGAMLKEIGRLARPDIEMMLGGKVYLDLWVKVRKDWRNRDAILKSLGFGQD